MNRSIGLGTASPGGPTRGGGASGEFLSGDCPEVSSELRLCPAERAWSTKRAPVTRGADCSTGADRLSPSVWSRRAGLASGATARTARRRWIVPGRITSPRSAQRPESSRVPSARRVWRVAPRRSVVTWVPDSRGAQPKRPSRHRGARCPGASTCTHDGAARGVLAPPDHYMSSRVGAWRVVHPRALDDVSCCALVCTWRAPGTRTPPRRAAEKWL
jgi:hypothetical protein